VPPIVEIMAGLPQDQRAQRARVRQYVKRIRLIAHEYLGEVRVEALRARGLAELRELDDPAAFEAMISELARERDDVRLAMLDHFAAQGAEGQAALARVAIYDDDPGIRQEATRRVTRPASPLVLRELDAALRSPRHSWANNAGALAGGLGALKTIPLLIFAQATADPVRGQGDLAWIAVGTRRAFVQRIEAVVENDVGAFRVIPGMISEGVILRVVDAVAVSYRTDVHRSLVAMTTEAWGRPTDDLAYDIRAWWQWYNTEFVPFINENERSRRAAGAAEGPAGGEAETP
jgi:hypothetical protein